MASAILAAAEVDLDDYFAMRLGERTKLDDDVDVYRFTVAVLYSNGRTFEELRIDVGFNDPPSRKANILTAPPLLEFAGIKPSIVRAISAEQHIAEKLHAYTRWYGTRRSTRVKDLVDIALLVADGRIDEAALLRSVRDVFDMRRTHNVPLTLPEPPAGWRVTYSRLARGLPIAQDVSEAYTYVAERLNDILRAANSDPEPDQTH